MADINKKAGRSESMVREITAEIKQLDRAKSNLTAAITALNHYHMLCGAAAALRGLAARRQYGALLPPLQAVMQVPTPLRPRPPDIPVFRKDVLPFSFGLFTSSEEDPSFSVYGRGHYLAIQGTYLQVDSQHLVHMS